MQRPGPNPGAFCYSALMSEISIRGVRESDLPAITRIYAEAVRHGTASFEIEPPDEAEMARRYRGLCAQDYPYLVAELAGTVTLARTAPGRPIDGLSRIRSISRRNFTAVASARGCWRAWSWTPRPPAFVR